MLQTTPIRGIDSRRLISFLFIGLHVSAMVFIGLTLSRGEFYREVLEIGLALSGWVAPLGIALVAICLILILLAALLAAKETRAATKRLFQGEPEPDVFLRLRVLCYFAVTCVFMNAFFFSTPETFSGPFRLRLPAVGSLSAILTYGAFVWGYIKRDRVRRAVSGRTRRRLELAAANLVLALVLAEIGLRVFATFWGSPFLITDATSAEVRRGAHRLPPGTPWFDFPINRGGHYDTEFLPNASVPGPLVVSIGDSFSYGFVPHSYHFTTVAERETPGVEIYNMGYSAIGPSDYLHLLEREARPLDPDLLVIQLFVGNDLEVDAEPVGPPRWHDADSYLIAIVWHRLLIMARAEPAVVEAAAPLTDETRQAIVTTYPFLEDPLLETPTLATEAYMELARGNAGRILLPEPGLFDRFFEVIEEIMRAAGDTPVKFVLIPEEFQVEDQIWEAIREGSDQPLERDLPQRRIVEEFGARGWPVLDLLPLLRAAEPLKDGRRHLYHLNNAHFNARGNEIAGQALARFLGPLPAAALPLHLDIGSPTARSVMQSGWHDDEEANGETFVWSDGPRSVLSVPLPAVDDVRLDLEAMPFSFPGAPEQRVTVVLNGTVLEEFPLQRGVQEVSLTLPKDSLVEAINTLEFRYAYVGIPRDVLPDSPDTRELAVGWFAADFSGVGP